ncbi:PilW family protein [Pseudofrancisella aestuarii]|uniref:PilW family protein n=1 Tax=Pseudofrancisella aestuarii TaxID=2670347 RepID=A0ABV9TEE0_9GAMM|nr:type II secretion system protein [Pseudofrancisella aestuarii]
MKLNRRLKGFSLVELMVAMVVAAIVMSMAIGIYISIKKEYKRINKIQEENSTQLVVKQVLYNTIKNSGFNLRFGYLSHNFEDKTGDYLDVFKKYGTITIGQLPVPSSSLPESLQSGACRYEQEKCFQPSTDYLMLQRDDGDATLSEAPEANILKISEEVKQTLQIAQDNYLLICNEAECDLAKVFSTGNEGEVALTAPLTGNFKAGDYIGKYSLDIYYIADSGKTDENNEPIYSLYVYIKQGSDEGTSYELVSDISNFTIEYVPRKFIKHGQQVSWEKVKEAYVDINSKNIAALKFSFKIKDRNFEQIVLLDKV